MRKFSLAFAGLLALSVPAFAGTVTAPASETLTVPPWNILNLTGSAANTACVATRLSDVPGQGQSQGSSAISGTTPVELGPYSTETRFSLRCTAGGVSYSSAAANFVVTGGIVASDIEASDSPADEECLTYDSTGPALEWQECGGSLADADYGDFTVAAGVAAIDANAVALGTDTTGGYAASLTEGGAATTATALAANPADCAANEFANAIAASGALTCAALVDADVPDTLTVDLATAASDLTCSDCIGGTEIDESSLVGVGGVGGSTGATDNAILAADGGGGATLQARDLTVSDVAGGVVTLATTAGNALTLDLVEPAAANGASVAGDPFVSSSGDAVASLDTAGAAAGGDYTIRAGDAARNTSGNANGGNIVLDIGTPIGSGVQGQILSGLAATVGVATNPTYSFQGDTNTGVYSGQADQVNFATNGVRRGTFSNTSLALDSIALTNSGVAAATVSGFNFVVEANTAGSGAPNVLAPSEVQKVLTNEGASAENYHTLPTAVAGNSFTFIVQDTDGIRITATAGDTIRIGATVSATGGFIRCGTVGGIVHLTSINATEWFVEEHYVTCTVDS